MGNAHLKKRQREERINKETSSVKGEGRQPIKMEKTDKKINKYWAPKKHIVVGENI